MDQIDGALNLILSNGQVVEGKTQRGGVKTGKRLQNAERHRGTPGFFAIKAGQFDGESSGVITSLR